MQRSTLTKGFAAASLALLATAQARADEVNGIRNSVAPVGDVDGDGAGDFALALRSDHRWEGGQPLGGERRDLGRVLVISGASGERLRFLERPGGSDPAFGRILEDLGDVDGDGWRDPAVADERCAWVFAGRDGRVLRQLGDPDRQSGRVLALGGGGDVDGDGRPDVVVLRALNERWEPTQTLAVVHSGATGRRLHAITTARDALHPGRADENDWSFVSSTSSFGAVGILPDLDGDGQAELGLATDGSLSADTFARGPEPRIRIVDEPERVLFVIDGARGRVLRRIGLPEMGEGLPWIVRSPGDTDGDGTPEILVAIVQEHLLLYSGASGEELHRHSWRGGYLNGEGTSCEILGDLDRDGVSDYLVAANEDWLDPDPGLVQVFSGRSGELLHDIDYGKQEQIYGVGADACGIGDVNGDEVPDVVVHLPRLREARIHSGVDFALLCSLDLAPGSALLNTDAARATR